MGDLFCSDHETDCSNNVKILEVPAPGEPAITIANVYDQRRATERPAQKANWTSISAAKVVIADDMNGRGTVWNGRVPDGRNSTFWADLIEQKSLVI
jgi:hypothetical protein